MNHVEVLRAMRQDGGCVDDAEWIAAVDAAIADMARLDWLSDRENTIGNVQLPTMCVMNNMGSLRGAIDEAMRLDRKSGMRLAELTREKLSMRSNA